MNEYESIPELVIAIERAWRPYQEYIRNLTPDQLEGPTDGAGWTVKDHIAHVAAWEGGIRALLQGEPRHEGMGITEDDLALGDVDEINERIRQAHAGVPAEEIVEDSVLRHEGFIMELEALPDETVYRKRREFTKQDDPDDRFFGDWVWHASGEHYREHLADLRRIVEVNGQ
jgi:uncharacterized protein (TIGR03083 family)